MLPHQIVHFWAQGPEHVRRWCTDHGAVHTPPGVISATFGAFAISEGDGGSVWSAQSSGTGLTTSGTFLRQVQGGAELQPLTRPLKIATILEGPNNIWSEFGAKGAGNFFLTFCGG